MGRRHTKGRNVLGILLLDKPAGITSNAALQTVKRLFRARKAGHTGSLDPLATGMLPICFGEATKISGFLLDSDKRYRLSCRLGIKTATGDAEGEVIEERPVPALTEADVERALVPLRGTIEQLPPMYSALKHQGERLYKLARAGQEVARDTRTVTIHELVLLGMSADTLELEVKCSKGTYVRTLAEDLGEALGCGAHVSALRRLEVGPYREPDQMVTLDELRHLAEDGNTALDRLLLPLESALGDYPAVRLSADSAFYIRQGQAVQVPRAPTEGWVRLYREDDHFLGMGEIQDDGKVAPRRLFHID
jgi:tRNA pseudouridine55 synthase